MVKTAQRRRGDRDEGKIVPGIGTVRGRQALMGALDRHFSLARHARSSNLHRGELIMLMMCKCIFSSFIKLAFPASLSLIFMLGYVPPENLQIALLIVQVKFIASWMKGRHPQAQACMPVGGRHFREDLR